MTQNPLSEEYTLTCQHDGCSGVRIISQVGSAGLVLGSMISKSSDPNYGRCLRCQRYTMKVTSVPAPPPPRAVEGFTRIPKK